jgi:Ca2+-binding RTX toxin-like protein
VELSLLGGDDLVKVHKDIPVPLWIDGGAGNDRLEGGDGNDVLLGGAGNDDLFARDGNDVVIGGDGADVLDGGDGRDLLIGGLHEDRLHAGADDDILIGGYTAHDNNLAALDAIMAIWTSANSFAARVAALTNPGGYLEAGVTVFDDDAADHIIGTAGRDLAFADTSRDFDGVKDTISLSSSQDTLIALN